MRAQVLSLTILASGDNRLWLWSNPPGDTCWSTDWLDGIALLLWWLMVVEEVTSPGPWLYRTERKRERHTHSLFHLVWLTSAVSYNKNSYIGQRDSSISLILSNTAVAPTNHLLFDSDSRGQSKQTHWPIRRCYLRTSAKAMNCTHALTTAKLPSAHKCYWRCLQLHQCEDSPVMEEVVRSFTWQCTQVLH